MKDYDTPINPGSADEFVVAMQPRFKELAAAHTKLLRPHETDDFARTIGGVVTDAALDKIHS